MNKSIAKPWLSLQCQMIPGVRHAVFAADKQIDGTFTTLENWPEGADLPATVRAALDAAIASEGVDVRKSDSDNLADSLGDSQVTPAAAWIVACPLRRGGEICGAVAVEVTGIDESQVPVITRLMLWGSAWPAFLADQETARRDQQINPALAVTSAALESNSFSATTTAAATSIAREYEADNVAIGLLDGSAMRLVAMSGRAEFDQRSDSVRVIESALNEALDQAVTIVFPAPEASRSLVTEAHSRLASNDRCACTVLLRLNDEIIGGLSLTRSVSRPFDSEEIDRIEEMTRVLGLALETRRLAERGVLSRASDTGSRLAGRLFGTGHWRFKALATGLVVLFAFLFLSTGTHYVSAPAILEGTVERDLVAPSDGFVAEAYVRAGTRVQEGELLATLDDKPLKLERSRLEGQWNELTNEHNRALGVLDHGATRVLTAQIKQAESQLALVDIELARIRILAPFDGLVVSGDLSQSLGSPVSRGDPLFRLAPLEGYRVILEVDEGDVQAIVEGAEGRLVLASLPRIQFDVHVDRTNGMARSLDGQNVLEVEASLLGEADHLRPGMKGVVRLDAGRARLLWIWTHRFVERIQLWWWAWSPTV